jgi:hypothetical protein
MVQIRDKLKDIRRLIHTSVVKTNGRSLEILAELRTIIALLVLL